MFPHKISAHRKVGIKKQLAAEGWPQSLEKAGMQLYSKWPPPQALLPAIAIYHAPSKEEWEQKIVIRGPAGQKEFRWSKVVSKCITISS